MLMIGVGFKMLNVHKIDLKSKQGQCLNAYLSCHVVQESLRPNITMWMIWW